MHVVRSQGTHLFLLVAEEGGAIQDTPATVPLTFLPANEVASGAGGEGRAIGRLEKGEGQTSHLTCDNTQKL